MRNRPCGFNIEGLQERFNAFLDYVEDRTSRDTGVYHISGGFATADYDDIDDEDIYFTLKWGIANDTEVRTYTEYYKISIENVLYSSVKKCYERMQEI